MNRQIKFRGKNIHTGQWLYGDYHCEGNTHYIAKPDQFCDYAPVQFIVDEKTVGQFTGITDEEGREVFEGDILEADYKYDIITANGGVDPDNDCICYGVVEFDNDTLQWSLNVYKAESHIREYLKEEDCSHVPLCIFGHEYGYANPNVKVIGNRYDDPELLELLKDNQQ